MTADMTQTQAWLEYLRGCGRKESTLHNYEKVLGRILNMMEENGRTTDAAGMTTDDVLFLYSNLPTKEEVTHSYLRVLAGLVIYHTGTDIVKQSKLLFNRERRDRVFIGPDDFRRLYAYANPYQRMILVLGGFMGLRRQEMYSLRDSDIKNGTMRVRGKGHGVDGMVVLLRVPAPVEQEIESFRSTVRGKRNSGDGYLLQNLNPREGMYSRTGLSTISNAITDLSRQTGIKVTVHSLRRFYATTLFYETGCDTATLKSLMRHADISTTFKCYIDAYDRKQREAQDRLVDYMEDLLVRQ